MRLKKLFLIIVLFTFSISCKEIHIKTTIKNNGQVLRTYQVITDLNSSKKRATQTTPKIKQEKFKNLYFPVDTTWKIKIKKDTIQKKKQVQYTRLFENIKILQEYYRTENYLLKPLSPEVSISRTFKWFYTQNTYTEKFQPIFRGIDYKKFFSKTEIKAIRNEEINEDSLLNLKFTQWIAYHIIHELAKIIEDESKIAHNLSAWEKSIKKKINRHSLNNPTTLKNPFNLEVPDNKESTDISNSELLLENAIQYTGLELADSSKTKIAQKLNKKMEIYMSLYSDKLWFSVEMQGDIIESNADSISQNVAHWKIDPFIAGAPFQMKVVSQQSNAGVIISIVAILIILISIWLIKRT